MFQFFKTIKLLWFYSETAEISNILDLCLYRVWQYRVVMCPAVSRPPEHAGAGRGAPPLETRLLQAGHEPPHHHPPVSAATT